MAARRGVKIVQKREPRKVVKPNDRQERFALAYAATWDKSEALRQAGYELNSAEAERDAANRLLRNPTVMAIIDREKARVAKKFEITAEGTALRFQVVYLEAMRIGDFATAKGCLIELGKYHGIYVKDNTQKKNYSREDIEKLKLELEQLGFDWSRVNARSEN